MSSILKWMVVLLLLIAVVIGGGAYWFTVKSNDILRAEVLKHLQKVAPDVKVALDLANYDILGRIRLHGLSFQLPGDVEPALFVPEAVISIDEDQMTRFEKVVLTRLRLINPQMRLVRQRDGDWNWQGLKWNTDKTAAVPEIHIEHGTIFVELQRDRRPTRKLKLADVSVKAVPSAFRKLTAAVTAQIDPAGPLSLTIDADLDSPVLKLEAKWMRLPVDDELLDLIGELSPAVHRKLQDARRAMDRLAATQAASMPIPDRRSRDVTQGVNAVPISLQSQVPLPSSAVPSPFGLKCECDLHCRLQLADPDSPLQYQILAEIHSGQFSNVLLPFPLYEIRGSVFADGRQIIVRDVRAENGATRLFLNTRVAPNESPRLNLQVRNFQIDEPLKARLPESVRRQVNSLALTGTCDLDLSSAQNTDAPGWSGDLRLSEGTVAHEKFPYPIRDVRGTVRLRGQLIEIEGEGRASGVPVTISGFVLNPGPANESEFVIKGAGVPINSTLLDACPPAVGKVLTDLDLQGKHDVWYRLWKAPGLGEKFRSSSRTKLRNCTCSFKGFPYRIQQLQGDIVWVDEIITFEKLSGNHDETALTADGNYVKGPGPGRLELEIHAKNGAFDRSLELAIPSSLKNLWHEFQPNGQFDVDARIHWIQGQPCRVDLPRIRVRDGEILMASFPWPMRAIDGEFSYAGSQLTCKGVTARHDDTRIRARGGASFPPGEPWRVTFEELIVDDLVPNVTFRKALPTALQRAFDALAPTGKFSFSTTPQGAVILSAGKTKALSALWDIEMVLADCGLTAGIQFQDIHGRIGLKGRCSDRETQLTGQLDLDSVSVFRLANGLAHQISNIKGPFKLENSMFTAGSAKMATPSPEVVPQSERICCDAIDGLLTVNATANLQNEPEYRVGIGLYRGKLETYARQYLREQSNLAGSMNGFLYLWGKGKSEDQIRGQGNLVIAPAALYELPLFVKLFRSFGLDPRNDVAFDRADVLYTIQNSRFNFNTIDLRGNAISLRGRGYVQFDGAMQLDFYSKLARNQIRIPVIHEIADLLSRGWMGVKVSGNVGSPETRILTLPELDDAMKQFFGTFDPQSQRSMPRAIQPFPPATGR
ncbi:MAG: hypothetical protein JSS49_02710 [Planctomycetes bacterium]|nr:hypothetical protein [Planctomycetota bacterium]